MRVTVIGLGYVGLVTAAGACTWRHETVGVDTDPARVAALRAGSVPFHEPGLDEAVADGLRDSLLHVSDSIAPAVRSAEIVFVAVGTHDGNGGWQTDTVTACLKSVLPYVADDATLVIRSTLPPAYLHALPELAREIRAAAGRPAVPLMLNPEFTKEGTALHDFLEPDRVVIGRIDDSTGRGAQALRTFYRQVDAPILEMTGIDASLTKLGSNLFLATKISFANELAALCDTYGAQVDEVVKAMGKDPRIGPKFLRAGVGFGGSCLPHQVSMVVRDAALEGRETPLLAAVDRINHDQRSAFVEALEASVGGSLAGRSVALLGLTFKPDTDDLRDAPSLTIAAELLARGAIVRAHDPMPTARVRAAAIVPGLEVCGSVEEALRDADAIGLVTEWAEYQQLDWTAVAGQTRGRTVVDGRNILPWAEVVRAGFDYRGFGRGSRLGTPVDAAVPRSGVGLDAEHDAVAMPLPVRASVAAAASSSAASAAAVAGDR